MNPISNENNPNLTTYNGQVYVPYDQIPPLNGFENI